MRTSRLVVLVLVGLVLFVGIVGSVLAIATSSHVEPASPDVIKESALVDSDHDADDDVEVGPTTNQNTDD